VVIPAGVEPHDALNDNKTYAVVWQVLQALRSHDDRFDAMVNKLDLIGKDPSKMEVVAITDKIHRKAPKTEKKKKNRAAGRQGFTIGAPVQHPTKEDQFDLQFEIGEIERAIYAKLVQKVGNRHHWEDWANDIAKIARTHIDRITAVLENKRNSREREAFAAFANELRDDLNDSITDSEIIEMLAQHLITKPVFDALFQGYSFAQHNPMSQAMQAVLDILQEHQIDKEADTLQTFYESVKQRAEGIDNAAGKQKIVLELYDKFFRNAFPKMAERLGIVYTPVEVVDFILHSVAHVLKTEFGQTLGSKGVHILDPFTGTGTFITRMLQSGLIAPDQLPYKYKNEIHANEVVLLAYYIAAINIEASYHGIVGGDYQPFDGICLTDTFQLYEKEDLVDSLLEKNSARRKRQKKLEIRVIVGNPPYSAGQTSANDNNQNIAYPHLDQHIADTYAARSKMTSVKNLYDSYIRAIRWASDRIGNSGVIGFVTNAGYLETNSADGLRLCLAEEFTSIYIFHLRGNQRTVGELSRKEGGKIFGSGSRAPIAISILVKNQAAKQRGQIFFHDIGDYLSREEKLEKVSAFGSIADMTDTGAWQAITPDHHGDWLNQRDDRFGEYIVLGDKKSGGIKLFENFSQGVLTSRDAWCYNASKTDVSKNMQHMVSFYNSELKRFAKAYGSLNKKSRAEKVSRYINTDPTHISWSSSLLDDLSGLHKADFAPKRVVTGQYRPFHKQWLYFDSMMNHRVSKMYSIFPDATADNRIICVNGSGGSKGATVIMTDRPIDFNALEAGAQCFPLYLYDVPESEEGEDESKTGDLFAVQGTSKGERRDAITDEGMAHFRTAYPGEKISKEDVFYYVYGLLHSPDYRERYADNLSKELPRIPRVKTADDFWTFSKAGRALAKLHLNYESVAPYKLKIECSKKKMTGADYRVEKIKYGKKDGEKDLTTVVYNDNITITGIPLEAYDYVVNGKPALDWVIERQCVKLDKDSGIVNDANEWANETMKSPRYPLELFLRIVTVSLETTKIVYSLPKLKIF